MIRRCFSVHLRNTILFISVQCDVFVCVCEGMTHFLTLCSLMTLGMNISGKSHLSPVSRQVAPWVCRLVWSKSTFGSFAEFDKNWICRFPTVVCFGIVSSIDFVRVNSVGDMSALFPHLLYFTLPPITYSAIIWLHNLNLHPSDYMFRVTASVLCIAPNCLYITL